MKKRFFYFLLIFFLTKKNSYSAENTSKNFDLIVIGGGSAAFNGIQIALKKGKSVLLINDGLRIGGTCVNVGCMPSKYLIKAADCIYRASYCPYPGIILKKPKINFQELIQSKKKYINTIWNNKYPIFKKKYKKLKIIKGWGNFKKINNKIYVIVNNKKFYGKKYLIATGSRPRIPNIKGLKKINYFTNRTLFDLEKKPQSLTILGSGYIGLELATIYSQLGIKVRVIEKSNRILPKEDLEISLEMEKQLKNFGIKFFKNCNLIQVKKKNNQIILICKEQKTFKKFEIIEKGHLVIASGIKPNTQNLGLQEIGIKCDKKENIIVNTKMETSVPHIYAAGDCVNTPAFLYVAVREGQVAISNAFNEKSIMVNYIGIPWVMFTNPEFSGAGLNESQAKKLNIPYDVSLLPLSYVTKTSTSLDKRGLIKLLKDRRTDKIIGGRAIGYNAGELGIQISNAIKYGIKLEDLQTNFYPYLTLSEGIQTAAQNFKK